MVKASPALARRWNRDPGFGSSLETRRERQGFVTLPVAAPDFNLIRHGRALDDVVRGGALVPRTVHVA